MATQERVLRTPRQEQRPELVESWVLVTLIETIFLVLLSPALFRRETWWGVLFLAIAVIFLVATIGLRRGLAFGYWCLAVLHPISVLALVGAGIAYLTVASPPIALVTVVLAYLAGLLRWKGLRGYAIVLYGLIAVVAVISLITAGDAEQGRTYAFLGLMAVYLFAGGAVRFYFGHSFNELDRPGVLRYFGFHGQPASRRWLTTALAKPGAWLEGSFQAVDGLLSRVRRPQPRRTAPGARPATAASGGQQALRAIAIAAGIIVFPYLVRLLEGATDISILISMNVGLLFVVLALGLNIVVGFAGLLDLGYAAFFAIGAYTVGVFTWPNLGLEWSFWIVILISILMAALFGMLIGAPTLRLRGDYLAIVTLAFGEIVPRAIRELWDIKIKIPFTDIYLISEKGFWYDSQGKFVEGFNLTNGPQGMNPVGRPTILGHEIGVNPIHLGPIVIPPPLQWYFLIVIVGIVVLVAAHRLENSRLGRAWMAIREDETAADAMGVDPIRTKLLAFALGASFSGFAGSIYAAMIQAIFPELFSFLVSIFLLIIVIVSGMGNIWGVLLGGLMISLFDRVVLAQIVPEFVPGGDVLQKWRWVMYASGLIAIMVLRPEGLFPSAARKAELHEAEEAVPEEEIVATLEREPA